MFFSLSRVRDARVPIAKVQNDDVQAAASKHRYKPAQPTGIVSRRKLAKLAVRTEICPSLSELLPSPGHSERTSCFLSRPHFLKLQSSPRAHVLMPKRPSSPLLRSLNSQLPEMLSTLRRYVEQESPSASARCHRRTGLAHRLGFRRALPAHPPAQTSRLRPCFAN